MLLKADTFTYYVAIAIQRFYKEREIHTKAEFLLYTPKDGEREKERASERRMTF